MYTFFPVHTGRDPSNICNNEQVKNLIYFKLFEKMIAIKHTHSSQLHLILRWRYLKNYIMLWVFVHRTKNICIEFKSILKHQDKFQICYK